MKTCRFLFLFFIFLALPLITLRAQNSKDSTTYHYRNILNPENKSDIPNAIEFYTSKKNRSLKSNKYEAISALRLIAIGQFNIGEIIESEKTVVEALKLIDTSTERDTLREAKKGLYNQLGKIYRSNFNFDKAQIAYDNALKYSKTERDSITIHNNKATIFKDEGEYNKALEELNIALRKKNIKKNQQDYSMVLNNLGYIQTKLLKDSLGLANIEKARQIREQINYLPGLYSSYHDLAEYYFERDDKEKAKDYAYKAYEVAKTLNSARYLEDVLSLFAIMSNNQQVVAYKTIRDSLEREKQLAQNKYAFIKYNVEKEKKKTAEAELAREKEKSQKTLYLFLVIGVVLVAIIIYIYLRGRHKREKLLQVHKTEARISKKVHDEVANDVYQLMAKAQGTVYDKEALLDDLENIYNKTRDISKENSAIEIGAYFSEQLNDLLLTYQTDVTAISTRNLVSLDWETIPKIKKETVYGVLQELMTNMKKYSNASAVLLTFQQNGKNITINYTDNGIGCTLKNKNGLQNAENRIQAIKGTITFESEPGNGFRSKISI